MPQCGRISSHGREGEVFLEDCPCKAEHFEPTKTPTRLCIQAASQRKTYLRERPRILSHLMHSPKRWESTAACNKQTMGTANRHLRPVGPQLLHFSQNALY